MPHYTYLVIGGGMTADAAIRGIQEVDPKGAVGLIGAEPHPPYNRPPLSKEYLAQDRDAGLPTDNGIVVDELLRVGHPDIYAAGDVANFYNPALAARIRVEHEDTALTMGRHAGRNMAGEVNPYHHLPYFYSDLFELGYEAVGKVDSRLDTTSDWSDPYRQGVIYY